MGSTLQPASLRLAGSMALHKRVQDRELIEMIDDGCCLSLHQPWASLLVAGIKVYVLLSYNFLCFSLGISVDNPHSRF
jgi:TPP-dependent trihydroxycyclohexane-1,2-dione (THcHDO) dehydratase